MGKTVKKILTGIAIVVSAGLLIPVVLAAGLSTLFVHALVAVQLLGISTIFNAFSPDFNTGSGGRLLAENLSIFSNPIAVRSIICGRAGIAGQILFRENIRNSGSTPDELLIILGLAGYPATSLEKFWLNEELIFDGDSTTGPGAITTGKFANELVVDFRTGEETTAAFPGIAALSTAWNAKARVLRGIPCLGIRLKITEKVDGKFQPLAQIKGSKLYDPRLDSTIPGGSGAHRFADPTTWAFSVNPKLAELLYLRGADVNGTRIFGMNKAAVAIDLENFAAEANVCEEQINVVGGGTIDRYTCNGLLIPNSNHKINLQRLLSASAGTIDASGGIYRTFAGAWRAPSKTLTEDDIDGAPTDMQLQIDQSKEVNVIGGVFAEPAEMWVVKEYPELKDAASITLFGENSKKLDLPFTTDHRIAQRISKIQLKRLNARRAFNANYWLRMVSLQPGDIVTQTYSRYRITAETFRIDFWALEASEDSQSNRRLHVAMRLVEELQSWFDWDETTEEKSINTGGLLPATTLPPVVIGPPGFSKIFQYDNLDTTTLAAGPSRYAMLTDSGDDTSGSQNNFENTQAILLNKIDLDGFPASTFLQSLRIRDRVVFAISTSRWFLFDVTSETSIVGTGAATAYKFNVSLIEFIDPNPAINQPVTSGNTVEFQFFQSLDGTFNILLDPDFDLSKDIVADIESYWDTIFTPPDPTDAIFTFGPDGVGGSNALTMKRDTGAGSTTMELDTKRRVRLNAVDGFEVLMKYKTTDTTGDLTFFSLAMFGYINPEDAAADESFAKVFTLPASLNVFTVIRIKLEQSTFGDGRFWKFLLNHSGTGESRKIVIDSIFVYQTGGTFADAQIVDDTDSKTYFTQGVVPKSDVTADSGKVLGNSGAWVFPGGDTKSKPANEPRTNDIALSDDDDLVGWPLVAGKQYGFDGVFHLSGSPGEFDYLFNFTNSPQNGIKAFVSVDDISDLETSGNSPVAVEDRILLGSGNQMVHIYGYFQANATTGGTVGLRWAQGISSGTSTLLIKGTWMRVFPVG